MMLGCGLVYLWASRQDIGLIVDQTLNSSFQLNVLLAIPMFVLAGNVMNAATISERIWAAADAVIGRLRAGLGHVTVLMNVVISSMSGSAVSDAAGAGMVAIQMMRKVGNYPAGLAVAITAAASCLGPIIPPSIPMVIYAILSGASVGALFLAGVVPGLLMAVSLMIMIAWIGWRRGLPFGNAVPLAELPRVFARAIVPLSLPVVLLGGIWGGIFTPTEAAAVAAFWAMVIGVGIYRNLGPKALYAVFALSARQSTVVMMLIVSSFIVNFALEREGVAQGARRLDRRPATSPLGFQLAVNVMFLILGTVLDGAVMLLVFVPVLLPAAKSLGIDLVHFGAGGDPQFHDRADHAALRADPVRAVRADRRPDARDQPRDLAVLPAAHHRAAGADRVSGDHALAALDVRLQGLTGRKLCPAVLRRRITPCACRTALRRPRTARSRAGAGLVEQPDGEAQPVAWCARWRCGAAASRSGRSCGGSPRPPRPPPRGRGPPPSRGRGSAGTAAARGKNATPQPVQRQSRHPGVMASRSRIAAAAVPP